MSTDLSIYQTQAIQNLESQISPDVTKQLKSSSQDFESVFLTQVLNTMFEEVNFNPMGGENSATRQYKAVLVEEMGNKLSEHSGIGLADHVYKSLLEAQIRAQSSAIE